MDLKSNLTDAYVEVSNMDKRIISKNRPILQLISDTA